MSAAFRIVVPLLAAVLAAAGGGCAATAVPDLDRLYRADRQDASRVPVIIVPGVLGSRLQDTATGREAWPGSLADIAFHDYRELALSIDPVTLEPRPDELVASGLFDRAVGKDFYGRIRAALEAAGGYVRGEPGVPVGGARRRYYEFAYDWRQDNVVTVRALDRLIDQIRADHADPRLRVDIVAHSMGGLIVRYYERYGTTDVLDDNDFPVTGEGAARIRRLVLLGTPNQGSVSAVHSFLNGYRVGLRRIPTQSIATMPSMFQLFPHPLVPWILTLDGRELERDLFDVDIWRRFEWSVFDAATRAAMDADRHVAWPDAATFERWFHKRLERGRRFVWSLTVATAEAQLIRPLVLGGNCSMTPARLVVEETRNDSVARLHPRDIDRPLDGIDYEVLMYEPGDGSVTKSSLLGRQTLDPAVPRHRHANVELDRAFFLCEDHGGLSGNRSFIDNLLHHLLAAE